MREMLSRRSTAAEHLKKRLTWHLHQIRNSCAQSAVCAYLHKSAFVAPGLAFLCFGGKRTNAEGKPGAAALLPSPYP